eukprot:739148-Rhodomonas_salina.2
MASFPCSSILFLSPFSQASLNPYEANTDTHDLLQPLQCQEEVRERSQKTGSRERRGQGREEGAGGGYPVSATPGQRGER